ncbi:MAG: CvpA family protein [Clostridia bacterium]|nr:CvpA family protein [Clostridia bacterium]
MNYVDIVIIAIVAFMGLWGLWKSFSKTFIKLICFALAIVGTYLVANFVINWLLSIEFIRNFIVGDGFSLKQLYFDAIGGDSFDPNNMSAVMSFFVTPMLDRFTSANIAAYGLNQAQFVAISLSINTLNIVLCLLIYAILRLVAMIVSWLLKLIFAHGKPNVFSRLLGFVFGAARGLAFVMVLLIASTAIFPFGWASEYADSVGNSVIGSQVSTITYKAYDWATYGNDDAKTIQLIESAGYTIGTP